jgi:hypothetical protein
MPTGYTAGILDGTTKDFKEYAKLCSRAFMIHLRDEPIDSEYTPRTPSNYHIKAITEAKLKLKEIEVLDDETIVKREYEKILNDIEYHEKAIVNKNENEVKLNQFLEKAKAYKPPTETHKGISDFMIEQIEKTIDFDCKDDDYHQKRINKLKENLKVLNADDIRGQLRAKATEDIAYNTKAHEEDLKRCRDSNNWDGRTDASDAGAHPARPSGECAAPGGVPEQV